MANIFTSTLGSHNDFSWEKLGDIKEGRESLGEEMPVLVYRLLEYSMNDILTKKLGPEGANDVFREAGFLAGSELAKNALDCTLGFDDFVAQVQKSLKDLKVGILRVENFDNTDGSFVITVAEDLDCSGLPPTNEVVCNYDEGFLSGVFETYTGHPYHVREVDCWATGDRVCRFQGNVVEQRDL